MTHSKHASSAWRQSTPPANLLVIVTRRIGDVLLATPLIRSLRATWPETAIDALVFAGTEEIIAANPDVRQTHVIPHRPGFPAHLVFLLRIARRYELALSLVPGDRPTLYAFVAGRRRAGLLLDIPKERWKRAFLHRWAPFDPLNTHTVRMHLALAEVVGVPPHPDPVVAWHADEANEVARLLGPVDGRLAVLHPYPKFNYKMWAEAAWIEVAAWLAGRGYGVVLTGGRDAAEIDYVSKLARRLRSRSINVAGQLTLGASACLVSRASVFVGPDTALTHVAAALGVPTIALFGPSDPVKWGPWPRGHAADANPWRRYGSQHSGNVTLLQGVAPCTPCLNEGCGSNIASFSDCLKQLPPAKVIAALAHALGEKEKSQAATVNAS
ncbi:MAG: glycosyltransferase family 9 protein [Betaproteobacteria bacterium]